MKKILFVILLVVSWTLEAQQTISGAFSPAEDFQWVIAYRLKPGTQVYVADTAVKNGEFKIILPKNAIPGTYRMVYAVPQEEFFFDIIFNGKENIELKFNMNDGVSFTVSEENILFNSYFKEVNRVEQRIIDYYTTGNTDEKLLGKIGRELKQVQKGYEEKSEGYIAQQFIKANAPFIPESNETIQSYVKGKKEHYFDHLDTSNPVLQASGFLTNKLLNYVFTALPLEQLDTVETTRIMNSNVNTVNTQLSGIKGQYKLHLFYSVWSQAIATGNEQVADHIYKVYLKGLAKAYDDKEIINSIEIYNRLRLGAVAPDMTWQKDGTTKTLRTLNEAELYVVVFWSSSCSHCLRELPALHKELSNHNNVKVIAVGLENEDVSWKYESSKMNHFDHVLALGKWDSEYADLYDIHQTPSYFLLDKDKVIIAKPEDDKAVIEFIRNM